MESIERMSRFLKRKSHDRIPVYEHFWNDTHEEWEKRGWVTADDDFDELFGFDMNECWAFNFMADLDFVPQVIEETEDTVLTLNGNGAKLRNHKKHSSTPEHVDFTVKDRKGWEELIKPKLIMGEQRRINFEAYSKARAKAAKNNRFFCWSGINSFECMHPVCGHEYMLIGMIDDPEWVADMAMTYAKLTISLMEELFAREGKPDGIWFYEDMGYKGSPFMSPAMYKELIQPAHKLTCAYAKSLSLPVIMHSCGMVEKLVPGMIESGIDCLQVIEVKAGMDLKRLYDSFGEKLSFMGGMDVRELYSNDTARVEAELRRNLPYAMGHYGYALHSDHSIPNTVDIDTFRYFLERGKEIGTYKN